MRENEAEAHKLVAALGERGVSAHVEGGGVHWHVDVAAVGARSLRIHCFWYEAGIGALMLGMNGANGRSRLTRKLPPHEGAEFYVCIQDGTAQIADGRTFILGEAVESAVVWLSGASLDDLEKTTPFVNERLRAMRAVGAKLDPRLQWEIGSDPSFELWVYGGRRSCCVRETSCSFHIGQAQVALAADSEDIAGDIAAWILERSSLSDLATRGAELERHAEVIEVDPARWHWLHVRDRIANPDDVLAPLAPLITILADSPVVSRFYTFSSLNRLCFSASSHYPWVGTFPVVAPTRAGAYWVDEVSCGVLEAVAKVESALAASPIEPFFGAAPERDLQLVTAAIVRLGSTMRPELKRHQQWSDVWLTRAARRCLVTSTSLMCFDQERALTADCANVDDVVGIAADFLDNGATLEDLAKDPRLVKAPWWSK